MRLQRAPDIANNRTMESARQTNVQFWSSVEYGAFLSGLVRELNARGMPSKQRYQISQYAYRSARSRCARFLLRIRMYGIYPVQLLWSVLTAPSNTVHVVCTNTFYAPLLAMYAGKLRRAPVIHWIYDLYPDVLTVAGKIREEGRTCRILERVFRCTVNAAAANVFPGDRLQRHATGRSGAIPRAVTIPIGTDASVFGVQPDIRPHNGASTVLYCGNMGYLHDTNTLLCFLNETAETTAAASLPLTYFRFHANGSGYTKLRNGLARSGAAETARGNIRIACDDSLPELEWRQALKESMIGLVTLRSGASGVALPSKAYSAMAAGQALLAICPGDSDLADLISAHECGWQITPGDVTTLRSVLHQIGSDPAEVARRRSNARRVIHTRYDVSILADHWEQLIEGVGAGRPDAHGASVAAHLSD